jgi:Fe-S cluster assembly protein SufD
MEAVAVRNGYVPEPVEAPGAPSWLAALRRSAFLAFEKAGFPTPHDEAWRYTGLQPITGTAWVTARAKL